MKRYILVGVIIFIVALLSMQNKKAISIQKNAFSSNRVKFLKQNAEDYDIKTRKYVI